MVKVVTHARKFDENISLRVKRFKFQLKHEYIFKMLDQVNWNNLTKIDKYSPNTILTSHSS